MHTVVLLQGKCKSINVYRRAIYRRARRWGKLIKKAPFPWPPLPKVYTHYVCFPSFLFPGDLHDSLDILLATFGNLPSGRAYVHKRAMGGDKPDFFPSFFPWPPLPLREAIYIYIYTHTLCLFFLLPFPWESS